MCVCVDLVSCLVICFFKQKTAYEMRISDWSSDVCSSDLKSRPGWRSEANGSSSHPEQAELRPFRYRRVQRSGKGEAKDVAGLGRIDHAVLPQPGGVMIGVALILIFLPDRGLEGIFFLPGPFVGVSGYGG